MQALQASTYVNEIPDTEIRAMYSFGLLLTISAVLRCNPAHFSKWITVQRG